MKKLFTELGTVEEFIEYYKSASRRELRARLKTLQKKNISMSRDNEASAIIALLA